MTNGASPAGMTPGGKSAADAVKLPAIFLIVIASIGILVALLGIFGGGMIMSMGGMGGEGVPEGMSPEDMERMRGSMMAAGGVYTAVFVLFLIINAVGLFGAIKMMKLQSWGLALTGTILLMIPCYTNCFIVGLGIGIWALIVLNKPEVKAAFKRGAA